MTAAPEIEAGQTAYEARFEGFTLGPRGVCPAWADLPPAAKAIWARVEERVLEARAAPKQRPDPILATLAAVSLARRQHLAALNGLNEDDEAQMRRANAAADAESVAFEELARVFPTTLTGLQALAWFYAGEAKADGPCCSADVYLMHLARALVGIESTWPFSPPRLENIDAGRPFASLIQNAEIAAILPVGGEA